MRRTLLAGVGTGSFALAFALIACATDDATDPNETPEASVLPATDAGDGPPDAALPCDSCAPDGGGRFTLATLTVDPRFNLFGIWGSSRNDVWAVGASGLIVHYDGTSWVSTPSGAEQALYAVWGSGPTDIWAASTSGLVVHRTASVAGPPAWSVEPSFDSTSWRTFSLWGIGTNTLYAVGTGEDLNLYSSVMGRRKSLPDGGGSWDEPPACVYCNVGYGIWGSGPADVWLVGDKGQAQHTAGADDAGALVWTAKQTYTNRTLFAVWGTGPGDVWAVGEAGTIRHFMNDASQKWSVVASPTTKNLRAVWGSGPDDVWAVGDAGVVIHYDGSAWTSVATGLASPFDVAPLFGVWGSGADDVWFVGTGVVVHVGKGPGK